MYHRQVHQLHRYRGQPEEKSVDRDLIIPSTMLHPGHICPDSVSSDFSGMDHLVSGPSAMPVRRLLFLIPLPISLLASGRFLRSCRVQNSYFPDSEDPAMQAGMRSSRSAGEHEEQNTFSD